ncbi:MAG: ComF family protein [Alphaproteobacteria bacterium]|nr:ComF family protein [Alphaproteobacteria bacterium]
MSLTAVKIPQSGLLIRWLDLLLPPLCLNCQTPVGGTQTLCPECWKAIRYIAAPFCVRCGAPFEVPVEDGTLCGACLDKLPDYDSARSAMVYDDASRALVLRLKHADRLHMVPALATWLQRVGGEILDRADMIIPVPLHRWRLLHRRYNQAALLAQNLGKATGVPVAVEALLRVRATPTQGRLNREQRAKNVAGAFKPHPRWASSIMEKKIVLIDDVLTTGATVNACAKALRKAGAAEIHVLTLARVRGHD